MLLQRKRLIYFSKLLVAYAVLAFFLAAPALSHDWRSHRAAERVPQLVTTTVQPHAEQAIGRPASITFVRQQKTLPVTEGRYSEDLASWTVAAKEVQWIQTGQHLIEGKPAIHAIFYGHATAAVLGVTNDIVAKDTVIITTEKGIALAYRYIGDEVVVPTNLGVLTETDSQRLTLITCKGLNNEYRRLLKFQFEGVVR